MVAKHGYNRTSGTTNDLYAVYFTNSNTGTAVGDGGTILRTTDSGMNWERQMSGTTTLLRAVYFINNNTGTVVGGTDMITDSGAILHTTNGGTTWIRQQSGIKIQMEADAVYSNNADTGFVGGNDYTNGNGMILRSTNCGTEWIEDSTIWGGGSFIYIVFFGADTGIAMSSDGTILQTKNGGKDWIKQSEMYLDIFGAYFIDANTGIAIGAPVDGQDGIIFRTTNGGINWNGQEYIQNKYLNNVFIVNTDTGFAVGDYGIIYRTTNGGVTTDVKENPFTDTLDEFALAQNYPNPFSTSTTISYYLTQSGNVSLKV